MQETPVSTNSETSRPPFTQSDIPPVSPQKPKLPLILGSVLVIFLVAAASFLFGRASVKPSSLSQVLPTPTPVISTPPLYPVIPKEFYGATPLPTGKLFPTNKLVFLLSTQKAFCPMRLVRT